MIKSRYYFLILIILIFGQIGLATAQSEADDPPTAVGLTRFEGFALDNAARIEWETGWEDSVAAFRLRRDTSETGAFDTVVDTVEAQGSGDYETIDDTAVNGQTYWYKLFEITTSNVEQLACSESEYEECQFSLMIEDGIVIEPPGGDNDDNGSNPTSTSVPTSTSQPTNTPIPTEEAEADNTPVPSNTPTATTETPPTAEPTASNTPIPAGPSPTSFTFPSATPTATPNLSPTEDGTDFTIISEVSAQEETPEFGYPAPLNTDDSGADDLLDDSNEETYPVATDTGPTIIGSDTDDDVAGEPADSATEETPTTTTGSRIFLWLAFGAGLLILLGGIVFSIMLAVRRK